LEPKVSRNFKYKIFGCRATNGDTCQVINGRGDNGGSCVMCQVTLKALRTCTKCENGHSMLALDVLSCLGVQMGLNEAQVRALRNYAHYFCS